MEVFSIGIKSLKCSNLVYIKATYHLSQIDLEINLI